jgi:hypothetical protein
MPSDPREDPSDPLGPSGPGPGDDVWTRRERAAVARVRVLLPGLVERRVPVRLVERGPVRGVGRLRMGDGTTFLVASLDPMALGRVVRTMTAGRSVVVVRWGETDDGLVLDLDEAPAGRPSTWSRSGIRRNGPVRVRVVGPDQPD